MADTMYVWPEWMDVAIVDDYGIQVVDRRIKTEMEIGKAYRVEFPDEDECTATCSLFCDEMQAAFFEAFERELLKQGSRWFKMPLWVGGQLENHIVRFAERFQLVSKDDIYTTYSFTLDVAKREGLLSGDILEILLIIDPDELHKLTNRLHYIMHVEAPEITLLPSNIWTATSAEWGIVHGH